MSNAPVFEITAEEADYDSKNQRITAVGDVRVRSGSFLGRAPVFQWDEGSRLGLFSGGVVLVDGLRVLDAAELELWQSSRMLELRDGTLRIKKNVAPAELLRLADSNAPLDATRAGNDALTLSACSITEQEGGSYLARQLHLSTCDCPAGEGGESGSCRPFLSFSSRNAVVTPNESAVMWWPLLRIFDVPVLPLPPIVFPLSDRRSGLLFPVFSFGGPGGIGLMQPVFLTLGQSADLTWRGGWFFGTELTEVGGRGFEGLAQDAELRWAPASHARGRLKIAHFYDRTRVPPELEESRGNRFLGEVSHGQDLLGGRLLLKGAVASDAGVLFDTEVMMGRMELPYLPSSLSYSRPGRLGSWTFGSSLGSTLIQSLRFDRGGVRLPISEGEGVLSPVGALNLYTHRNFGPLNLSGGGVLLREASIPGLELADGRSDRLLSGLRLSQTLPIATGRYGQLAFEAGERLDFIVRTLPDVPGSGAGEGFRAGTFAGLRAGTRIRRRFGESWEHRIEPSFRVRGYWAGGDAPFLENPFGPREFAPQSVEDVALPAGAGVQAISRLSTALRRSDWHALTLFAEHHFGLEAQRPALLAGEAPLAGGRAGQLRVGGETSLPPFALSARVRGSGAWDLESGELAAVDVGLSAGLWGAFLHLRGLYVGRSDLYGTGPDMLFASRAGVTAPLGAQEILEGSISFPLYFGLRLRAGANQTRFLEDPSAKPRRELTGGLHWEAGGCASFALGVVWNPESDGPPVLDFVFQLGELRPTAVATEPAFARSFDDAEEWQRWEDPAEDALGVGELESDPETELKIEQEIEPMTDSETVQNTELEIEPNTDPNTELKT